MSEKAAVDPRYTDEETIRSIISTAKTIAVVGLSPKPDRPSNEVAAYLQRHGYRIIPVNPAETEILGERCYASLSEIPEHVDVVDVFRKREAVPPIAEEAVKIGADALWLQLDIVSPEAGKTAEDGGLKVVMDRCIKVEHERLSASGAVR